MAEALRFSESKLEDEANKLRTEQEEEDARLKVRMESEEEDARLKVRMESEEESKKLRTEREEEDARLESEQREAAEEEGAAQAREQEESKSEEEERAAAEERPEQGEEQAEEQAESARPRGDHSWSTEFFSPQQQAAARARLANRGVLPTPAPAPSFSRIWWQAPSANQVKELVELGCGPLADELLRRRCDSRAWS